MDCIYRIQTLELMRYFISFLLLLPILAFSQDPSIIVDNVGTPGRISFTGPYQTIQIGEGSGDSISTGLYNTYIGKQTGSNNSTGNRNVFLGSNAGLQNTTGSSNINIGNITGTLNQTGNGNINIGDSAGYNDVTGDNNVRIGNLSGAGMSGSRNVFLGFSSGYFAQGDDQLVIANTFNKAPLITGDFAADSLTINGDLHITDSIYGTIYSESIDVSQITGFLDPSPHVVSFTDVHYNTVKVNIDGILESKFVMAGPVGIVVDTTWSDSTCDGSNTGLNRENFLFLQTDNPTDTAILNDLFDLLPSPVLNGEIFIHDLAGNTKFSYSFSDFKPFDKREVEDGRTQYMFWPTAFVGDYVLGIVRSGPDFGSTQFSYNPLTDKKVEILGITHDNFFPAVQVDYAKRIIVLEITYDEGAGLHDWCDDFARGIINKKTVSIIETTNNGQTETSRENFSGASAISFEILSGFGLDTKLKARIEIFYACNAPG